MSKRQNIYFDEVKTSLIITFELKWPTLIAGLSADIVLFLLSVVSLKLRFTIQCSLKSRYTTSSPSKLNCPASNTEAKI